CFSGSAVEYDGKLWLIYTGHHYTDPNDQEQFYEDQNLAYSTDGIHFTKYEGNPVLTTPSGNTKHFRDPKVWQDGDTFYMVLGSQGEDGLGRALLYQSHNLIDWKELPILDKARDRKSTRLNSSHVSISYAVFCLKKKINAVKRIKSVNYKYTPV